MKIIDLGCREGEDTVAFASEGHEVLSFDANFEMVQQTKKNCQESDIDVEIICAAVGSNSGISVFYVNEEKTD